MSPNVSKWHVGWFPRHPALDTDPMDPQRHVGGFLHPHRRSQPPKSLCDALGGFLSPPPPTLPSTTLNVSLRHVGWFSPPYALDVGQHDPQRVEMARWGVSSSLYPRHRPHRPHRPPTCRFDTLGGFLFPLPSTLTPTTRAGRVSTDCVQNHFGLCSRGHCIYEENRLGFHRVFESQIKIVQDYRPDSETSNSYFPPDIAEAIHQLWKDPIITKIMDEHSSEFYLMDSAAYFFGEVMRIGSADYLPDITDVLRARQKGVGITETRFTMGQLSIHMFDAGGQRSERKKWIHCFESVTSIIFCTAQSEYDQGFLESYGGTANLVRISHQFTVVFMDVYHFFHFLFLNKIDVSRQ